MWLCSGGCPPGVSQSRPLANEERPVSAVAQLLSVVPVQGVCGKKTKLKLKKS
ncbi:hypothetical protein BaRGS_00025492, partial [Batillaria attramentaria]